MKAINNGTFININNKIIYFTIFKYPLTALFMKTGKRISTKMFFAKEI